MSNILQKGQTGFGILIEQDAGYISRDLNPSFLNESINISPDEPVLINCILQKYGVENKNGRIYPKEILIPQVEAYQKLVDTNSAGGEADHPDSSVISLDNIAHMIKKMWWGNGSDDQHVLYGQLEIITSPAYAKQGIVSMVGDKVVEYMKRGMQLGISSRGVGSLKEMDGKNLVQDDFELICFDLVVSPSTPGAYLFPSKNEIQVGESTIKNQETISENEQKILSAVNKFLINS